MPAVTDIPSSPPCPDTASGMDPTNFACAVGAARTVYMDANVGNLTAAANDSSKSQNYVNSIGDDLARSVAQSYLDGANVAWQNVTPSQAADNSQNFQDATNDLQKNNISVSNDPAVIAAAQSENQDITNAVAAQKAGKDPALAYLGIPDPGGIGTALNLSGQSPKPGLKGLTGGGLAFLGASTTILVVVVLGVAFVYARTLRII